MGAGVGVSPFASAPPPPHQSIGEGVVYFVLQVTARMPLRDHADYGFPSAAPFVFPFYVKLHISTRQSNLASCGAVPGSSTRNILTGSYQHMHLHIRGGGL